MVLQFGAKKEVPDNVAVINATDLSPIMEHTQVKEIREIVAPDNKISTRPVEISLKVAELPTTTPIEVNTRNDMQCSDGSVIYCLPSETYVM